MQAPNLAAFFPGLSGSLPPSVRTPEISPVAEPGVHHFANSPVVVLDPIRAKDAVEVIDVAKLKIPPGKPTHPAGSTFVSTREYLAYTSAKGVRVLNRSTGATAMLKGHSQPLTDMAFTNGGSNLATCADDGLCIVWDIILNEDDSSLTTSETIRLKSPSGDGIQRVVFHPVDPLLFFVAHGPSASAVRLNQQVWQVFQQYPDKESGLPIELVASYRLTGVHTQTINDLTFSADGRFMVTASNDGTAVVFGIDFSRDNDLRALRKFELGKPVIFATLVGNSVLCGFPHMEEMVLIAASGRELSRARFTTSVSGSAVRMRAQALQDGSSVVLCDSNSPVAVLVQADENGIHTAVLIKAPAPTMTFSCTSDVPDASAPDALSINVVGESMIQVLNIKSISALFPRKASPAHSQVSKSVQTVAPMPQTPGAQVRPSTGQQQALNYPHQPSAGPSGGDGMLAQRAISAPQPIIAPNGMPSDIDRLLDEKLNALNAKFATAMAEQERKIKVEMIQLVDVITTAMAAFPPMIEEKVVTYFRSEEYAESMAAALKAGLDASGQKATIDKAIKAGMQDMSNFMSQQITTKVQQSVNKAFEDSFRQRLVPAFEAGCRDMMQQFESSLSKRVVSRSSGGMEQNVNSRKNVEEAIARGDFAGALSMATAEGDSQLLVDACEKVNLTHLLTPGQAHGLSQSLLVSLLRALVQDISHEPSKRLEWIEMLLTGGGLTRPSPELEGQARSAAREATAALTANAKLFASLSAPRYSTTVYLLNLLGGNA